MPSTWGSEGQEKRAVRCWPATSQVLAGHYERTSRCDSEEIRIVKQEHGRREARGGGQQTVMRKTGMMSRRQEGPAEVCSHVFKEKAVTRVASLFPVALGHVGAGAAGRELGPEAAGEVAKGGPALHGAELVRECAEGSGTVVGSGGLRTCEERDWPESGHK